MAPIAVSRARVLRLTPAAAGSERAAVRALAINHGLFALVPLIFTAFFMWAAVRAHAFAVDFHNGEWPAGQRLLHGMSPYFGPHSAAVRSAGSPYPAVTPMVYPALGALLFGVLALLPHASADILFTALDLGAVLGALRLLEVRDWRLYGVAFLWPPVVSGWQTANLGLLLVLGLAATWRYRDNPAVAGAIVATLVSLKLILWPLGLWLLFTRRLKAFAFAVASGLALNTLAWGVLGFHELPRYLRMLQAFDAAGEHRAYSIFNLARHLGASHAAASILTVAIAALAALACLVTALRGRERAAFVLSIGVALAATPIIWLHYFALLLVPLALLRPRLGPLWFVPLVLIVCPATAPGTWQIELALAVALAVSVGPFFLPARAPLPRWRPAHRIA